MNTLSLLIEDLGGCQKVARLLEVHHSTVYRWRAGTLKIPRAHLRAIQSASSWGRQERQVMTLNEKRTLHALVAAQRVEIRTLEHQVNKLLALSDFGAANRPMWQLIRAS